MNIRPSRDRAVVRLIGADTVTKGGIFIPDAATEKPDQGEVLAVGSGRVTPNGQTIAMEVAVGDRILFTKNAGQTVKVNEQVYHILEEKDIIAVVE